jgi:putative ABC transport system permease protein
MLLRWQHPRTGEARGIIALGIDSTDDVFNVPEIREKQRRLTSAEFLLIDRKSRADYGPVNGRRFGSEDIGVETEIMSQRVRIVEHVELGTGLAANGAAILNEAGFARVAPVDGIHEVSMGLVQLRPGVDPVTAAAAIRDGLRAAYPHGAPVEVLARQEVIRRELARWVDDTPIGAIFKMGVAVAFLVGAAVVYMVLSNDVTNHVREYATLAAMGYSHGWLSAVVLKQALCLAVLAFIPAWAAAEVLYRATSQLANIPIQMTWGRPPFVLGLSLAMCLLSGTGALRKLRKVAPADLF